MKKYNVYMDLNILLEEKEIEANSPEEAKEIYEKMIEDGEVKEIDREISDFQAELELEE